jgi:hypothetical protein
VIFNRECRVPFVLAARPRWAFGLLPGLARARDRFTAWSPSLRGRRLLPLPASPGHLSRRIRTLTGFRWIVPVTVSRASSAASGRCRPALTGVGAVPCDQSAAVTVPSGRRITPPSASAAFSPITARRVRSGQRDFAASGCGGLPLHAQGRARSGRQRARVLAAALFEHESAAFGVRVSAWFGGELLLGAGGGGCRCARRWRRLLAGPAGVTSQAGRLPGRTYHCANHDLVAAGDSLPVRLRR